MYVSKDSSSIAQRIITGAVIGTTGLLCVAVGVVFAQAPKISSVRIASTTPNSAVISWQTDKESDSTITFGLDARHGIIRNATQDRVEHQIEIDELDPSTTYYFRVQSTDSNGNQTLSQGYTFTTEGIRDIPELNQVQSPQQRALAEQAITAVDQITDPDALEAVQEAVSQQAQDTQKPPSIIGTPRVEEVGSDFAVITWQTDQEASSLVRVAPEDAYNASNANPYTMSQGGSGAMTLDHEVRVGGLEPSTTYHFQVESESGSLGLTGTSEDATFTTTSVLPQIQNIQIAKIQETSATIAWTTDAPAAGEIEFTNQATGETRTAGNEAQVTQHSIQLENLQFGITYNAIVRAVTESGDEVESDPFSFTTVRDEAPPEISKVANESTLFPGEELRIRTLISWNTDEPAQCQLFYQKGAGNQEPVAVDPVEEFKSRHVVPIVGLAPSTVYQYWIECEDNAGNIEESEDFVMFTPTKEKNIIDLILENFEGTFGWVKNITN